LCFKDLIQSDEYRSELRMTPVIVFHPVMIAMWLLIIAGVFLNADKEKPITPNPKELLNSAVGDYH
jgi:hypothetical protein